MKKINKSLIKFFVVGASAFLIDFGILNTLVYLLNFRVQLFNFVLLANVISTVVAVLIGFYFQKHWTFNSRSYAKIKREFGLFVTLQLFNIIVYNSLIFNVLVNLGHIPIPVSKILVTCVQMVTSYLAMRFLIFSEHQSVLSSEAASYE